MKVFYFITLIIFQACLFAANNTPKSASQAYNAHRPYKINVNAATGSVIFKYPVISIRGILQQFTLNLVFLENSSGLFGFSDGWSFDLDYISDRAVHLNGKKWQIDSNWRDSSGYASGLRYFNQQGTAFTDYQSARLVPGYKDLFYRYVVCFKDGSVKYFSEQGLLIVSKDRFGNALQFHYIEPVVALQKAKLDAIIDNYGHRYRFVYAPDEIKIITPDDRETKIYTSSHSVSAIVDPTNQKTSFQYIDYLGQRLIKSIDAPEGLVSTFDYDKIPVMLESGDVSYLPVAINFYQYDKSTNQIHQNMSYEYLTGSNFTGYPYYKISRAKDTLIESKDENFHYWVKVKQWDLNENKALIQVKTFKYNYLHMPVEVTSFKEDKPFIIAKHQYDISPFYASRSANYDKPIISTEHIWNDEKKDFLPTQKTTFSYDNFGNLLSEVKSAFNPDTNVYENNHSEFNEYYTNSFSLLKNKHTIDHLSGLEQKEEYSLNALKNHHQKMTRSFKNKEKESFIDWDEKNYQCDANGRNIFIEHKGLANQKNPKTFVTKKRYNINKENGLLTIEKENGLGEINRMVFNTKNGQHIKSIKPMGQETTFSYDNANRIIERVSPEGRSVSYEYLSYQDHKKNAVIYTTPMGKIHRKVFDGGHREVMQEDFHEGRYRRKYENKFNAFGLLVESVDMLGRKSRIDYDDQLRPIKKTDIHGNVKTIVYNDNKRESLLYENGQMIFSRKSYPWNQSYQDTYFPFEKNKTFTANHYIERTFTKDTNGKLLTLGNSLKRLQDDSTIVSKHSAFTFDINNQISQFTITGSDDIKRSVAYLYDLHGNKSKATVTQHSGKLKTSHEGYYYQFDLAGRLIAENVPNDTDQTQLKTQYTYDANGQMIKRINRDGTLIDYIYDNDGWLLATSWYREGNKYRIDHTYDNDGHIIKSEDSEGGEQRFIFDDHGRLAKVYFYGVGEYFQQYTYDEFDRVVEFISPRYKQFYEYAMEGNGQLTGIRVADNTLIFDYGEDENGKKGAKIRVSSIKGEAKSYVQTLHYDAFAYLAQQNTHYDALDMNYQVSYQRNALGDILRQTEKLDNSSGNEVLEELHYEYDSLRRLIKETRHSTSSDSHEHFNVSDFVYDGINNLLVETHQSLDKTEKITRTYNAENQLITVKDGAGVCFPEYDKNGRLIKDCKGRQFSYDDNDFLLLGINANKERIYFSYFPDGTLSRRSKNGNHQFFFPDKDKRIVDTLDRGYWSRLLRDKNQIFASLDASNSIDMLKANHSTSIFHNQVYWDKVNYGAYGQRQGGDIENIWQNFGWNQEYNDPDLSLAYLLNRFHHIENRQFISIDIEQLMNRRAFAKANPISFTDPFGNTTAQIVNYSLGTGIAAISVFFLIAAIPSGGASLALLPAIGVGSGVTGVVSGLSLVGSQLSYDLGKESIAEALKITSIVAGVAAAIGDLVYFAPRITGLLGADPIVQSTGESATAGLNHELIGMKSIYGDSQFSLSANRVSASAEALGAETGSISSRGTFGSFASHATVIRRIVRSASPSTEIMPPAETSFARTSEALLRRVYGPEWHLTESVSLHSFTGELTQPIEMSRLLSAPGSALQITNDTGELESLMGTAQVESDML
ncbi:MAG: hypothetical protein OXE99_09845 [Cellvibrionales bacterium]|nr:hypothetical protein [Cellvibrionales bacterium]